MVDIIRRHGMAERVIISSFNPVRLRRFRQAAPGIPVGFLHEGSVPAHLRLLSRALLLGVSTEADHPDQRMISAAYVAEQHRQNRRVNVWVANDPDRMTALCEMGVDLIMSDRPDVLRKVLDSRANLPSTTHERERVMPDLIVNADDLGHAPGSTGASSRLTWTGS